MSFLAWPFKDPAELADYDIDWSQRLAQPTLTDSILNSTWVITSPTTVGEPVLVINSSSFTTNRTKVWLKSGTLGQTYTLQNTVTTLNGDTLIESVTLVIRQK